MLHNEQLASGSGSNLSHYTLSVISKNMNDHQIDWQAAQLITPINTWHPRCIREAIEIFKHDTVPQDIGFYISDIWRPLLRTEGSSISKVHDPPQTEGSPTS